MSVREIKLRPGASVRWAAIPVADGIRAGISLRAAGTMAFSKRHLLPHRAALFQELGIAEHRAYGLRQIHSKTVLSTDGLLPAALAEREADAMIARADAVLTITVADCLPIFLVDRATGAFGLAHSGWKGTGIVREALAALRQRFGSDPRDVAVTIGPGIGPCCYRVPEERAALFARQFGSASVVRGADGQPRLDLREANLALLQDAGVRDITAVTDCTCCTPALGSFRRQGPTDYTLMLAWIGREGAEEVGQ
jgi:polyphenol oxidase